MAGSGADRNSIYSLYPVQLTLGSGATMTLPVIPGQNAMTIKYLSGGSLMIFGSTLPGVGASFVTAWQYVFGTSEILNFDGAGTVNIAAPGVTTLFTVLYGRAAGGVSGLGQGF